MKLIPHSLHILELGAAAATLTLVAGCASHRAYLVPAPSANLENGGHAATASADGVKITVVPNAWNGRPQDLYRLVTPMKVRIENKSDRPIRLAYEDFALEGPNGTEFAALPPTEVTGDPPSDPPRGAEPGDRNAYDGDHDRDRDRVVITPAFDWDDFYYAPYWDYDYDGIGPWPYAWAPDAGYYDSYYPYMRSFRLPSRSMLRKGLPEGVIAAGGYVDGFLYFRKVNRDMTELNFVAKLQGARTGRQFATIQIPFDVESNS